MISGEEKHRALIQAGWQRCKCGCGKWCTQGKAWAGWGDIDYAHALIGISIPLENCPSRAQEDPI